MPLLTLSFSTSVDVVPVMRERWSVDPFAADIQADGRIIARGAQDMKPVCMQYLEALLRLLRGPERVANFARTVHLSFMPDEETGGEWGMQVRVRRKQRETGLDLDWTDGARLCRCTRGVGRGRGKGQGWESQHGLCACWMLTEMGGNPRVQGAQRWFRTRRGYR